MTEQHECEWELVPCPDDTFYLATCNKCGVVPTNQEIEAILNEHSKLKRATEALSARAASMAADDLCAIRDAVSHQIPQFTGGIIKQLRAYADALAR